jgi:hypothetical protein
MDQFEWDGRRLSGERREIAIWLTPPVGHSSPPLLVAARTHEARCLVRPEDLGTFLKVHRDAVIACHDAGATHWAIADHLGSRDREGLDVLWGYSRESRLHDVGLLD